MRKYPIIIVLLITFLGLVGWGVSSVYATGLGDAVGNLGKVTANTGLTPSFSDSLGTVIKTVLSLVGTLFLGLTIYAGILWMTASGREEKVEKAKNIIQAAIIGLVVTMSAYAITYFVTAKLGSMSGGGGGGESPTEKSGGGAGGPGCCSRDGGKVTYEALEEGESCAEGDYIRGVESEAACSINLFPHCCEYDCGFLCSNYSWKESGECDDTFEGDNFDSVTDDENSADCTGD